MLCAAAALLFWRALPSTFFAANYATSAGPYDTYVQEYVDTVQVGGFLNCERSDFFKFWMRMHAACVYLEVGLNLHALRACRFFACACRTSTSSLSTTTQTFRTAGVCLHNIPSNLSLAVAIPAPPPLKASRLWLDVCCSADNVTMDGYRSNLQVCGARHGCVRCACGETTAQVAALRLGAHQWEPKLQHHRVAGMRAVAC